MMSILEKARLVNEFAGEYMTEQNDLELELFFTVNNLGIPFSIGLTNNFITLEKSGEEIIEETWIDLCNLMDLDPNEEYKDIWQMIEESDSF